MAKIIVYSTPTCPYCNMAKEYFKKKDLDFEDINVAENHEKSHEMIEKSGQMGVPVIDIDGEVIVGFDKQKIENLLS